MGQVATPTLEQRINDGREAERLMADDSPLGRAVHTLEREYIDGWRQSQPGDHQARESFYNRLHVLIDVRDAIQRIILDGRMAEREGERLRREETNG